MIDKIVIASNNEGKIREFKEIFKDYNVDLLTLSDLKINIDIEETGKTFEENAYIKAKTIYDMTKIPTIADDSGLVVDYLNGAPGVMSARYAGLNAESEDRIKKVLFEMKDAGPSERSAKFVSFIVFIISDSEIIKASGECFGSLAFEPRGTNGFGYDPIFVVDGKTLAEISDEEKNKISHRGRALRNLKELIEKGNLMNGQ